MNFFLKIFYKRLKTYDIFQSGDFISYDGRSVFIPKKMRGSYVGNMIFLKRSRQIDSSSHNPADIMTSVYSFEDESYFYKLNINIYGFRLRWHFNSKTKFPRSNLHKNKYHIFNF